MRPVKRVLLIVPPSFTTPERTDVEPCLAMGPAYLAAVLEREGIEVQIVDSIMEGWEREEVIRPGLVNVGLGFKEIEQRILAYGPDLVGVSCMFTKQRRNAHEVAKIVKANDKNCITVMGGHHATVCTEEVMADPNVDFVIIGEGELPFLDLIKHLNGKGSLDQLQGISYRDNDGSTVKRSRVKLVEDLDSLPFPARHLLNMDAYFLTEKCRAGIYHKSEAVSPIITSRGCPAKCTFCATQAVFGYGFRSRSPENVLKEMREMRDDYGISEIMFEDDNTTMDPRRAERIFDMMTEEGLGFRWNTPNGVAAWTLSKSLIKKMVNSGCYSMNFAIESGNQEHLRVRIKKPLRLEKIGPLVQYARELGCEVNAFLIIGTPGETEEMIWDSFRFCVEIGIYNPYINVYIPYPGSALYRECVEKGYLPKNFSFEDVITDKFCLSTPELSAARLRSVYQAGRRWLLMQHFIHEPIDFMRMHRQHIGRLFRLSGIQHAAKELGLAR